MEGSGSTTQKILADVLNGGPPQSRHKGACVGLVTMDQSQMWTWGRGTKILNILQTSYFLYILLLGLLASACAFVYPKLGLLQLWGFLWLEEPKQEGQQGLCTRARARTHLTYSPSYLHPVYTEVITVKPRLTMETEKQIMRA